WSVETDDGEWYADLEGQDSILEHLYSNAGIYNLKAVFRTEFGCSDSIEGRTITAYARPQALFDWLPVQPSLDDNRVNFNNMSSGAEAWIWNFNDKSSSNEQNPTYIFTDTGLKRISLIAISNQNCRDTFEGSFVLRANYKLFIPTAFSPDGNTDNEFWVPYASGVSDISFSIWSRWGEKIYSGDLNHPWDGKYKGIPVEQGVYIYQLEVRTLQGERYYLNGSISLLR